MGSSSCSGHKGEMCLVHLDLIVKTIKTKKNNTLFRVCVCVCVCLIHVSCVCLNECVWENGEGRLSEAVCVCVRE